MQTHAPNRVSGDVAVDGRSAVDLLRELRDEITLLLRQETQLAKTEIAEKVSRLARNAVYAMVGAVVAFAGVIVLLLAVVAGLYVLLEWAGLSNMTAGWLAPLIVGGVVAIIGYAFIQKALITLRHESAVPQRTIDSMNENKEWAKEKVSKS